MKIRSIAAAAALAAVSGQVFALSPAQVADASTVKVYMSGATALRNVIGGLFTQNCEADLDVYYSGIGTFGGVQFTAIGDAHRVYACTMKASSPILPGKKVALFKSDLGGSGQGVFPVYFGAVAPFPTRTFLALTDATCGTRAGSVPNYTCSTEQNQVPMAGVSDVEPGLFKGVNTPPDDPNYPQDGLSAAQLADLDTAPLFQTVFGVAVNKALRDAMQAKQGKTAGSDADADRPSISLAEATSYFAGNLSDPSSGLGWQPIVSSSDAKRATRVNVCRRVNGSGTQASANAMLVQFPCNGSGPAPIGYDFSDGGLPNLVSSVGPTGNIFVFEGSTTGNVISCLGAAEDTGAYAIGHVSKENNELGTGSKWRHVALDGIAPNRDNTKNGKYNYFFESTMQWHVAKFASLSQDQKDFLAQFRTEAQKPDSLAKLSASAQLGVAALPDSYAGTFGTGTANEIAFGSRVLRGGNSCNLPTIAK
jgi:hypothetical protein